MRVFAKTQPVWTCVSSVLRLRGAVQCNGLCMGGGVAVLRNPCRWALRTHTVYGGVCLNEMVLSPCQSLCLEKLT